MAALLSLALSLGVVEIGLRIFWKDYPENIEPVQTTIYEKAGDRREQYTLVPGISGYYNFTHYRHNARGYRGPEYGDKRDGKLRIAIVGDSFIYGISLPESSSICARLEYLFTQSGESAECINAGVPGYNLEQNVAHVKRVVADYKPDVVILSFIYNDLENLINGIDGAMPVLKSSPFGGRKKREWADVLSQTMLPSRFRLRPTRSVRFRYWLANKWRTYLYVSMQLRREAEFSYNPAKRNFTFPQTESAQMRKMIWDKARGEIAEFKKLSDSSGFKPLLMIYMDFYVEGGPVQKLKELAKEADVSVLDLSPYWGNMKNYSRRYSVGWDPHPNTASNTVAARVIQDYVAVKRWGPRGASREQKAGYNEYLRLLERHERESKRIADGQKKAYAALRETFSSEIGPEADGKSGAPEDQWLYGWWPEGAFGWDKRGGRWMSGGGGFILKAPRGGARKLVLKGYRIESENPPPNLKMKIVCGEMKTPGSLSVAVGDFEYSLFLSSGLVVDDFLECEIYVTRVVSPATLGADKKDNRFISLAFTRIALE